jgi:hypothetical protein
MTDQAIISPDKDFIIAHYQQKLANVELELAVEKGKVNSLQSMIRDMAKQQEEARATTPRSYVGDPNEPVSADALTEDPTEEKEEF